MLSWVCSVSAQEEPEFIGEALLINSDGTSTQLDKEFAQFRSGVSWSSNSWDARFLKIDSGKSSIRLPKGTSPEIIVRAVDNNSDPMSIITIYKFKSSSSKREVKLAVNNTNQLFGGSYTVTKDMQSFNGKKFGNSSYRIKLNNLAPGEYGIIVANPNAVDQKRVIVSCFAIDK